MRALIHPDDIEPPLELARAHVERRTDPAHRFPRAAAEWRDALVHRHCGGERRSNGRVLRISGVTIDITDRKEAEERQGLLAREVDHRARNALAVIQSIIRLTRAKNVDDYVQTVEGRIKALARAHTLLSDSRWHGADLGTLVAEELAPYRAGDKVKIKGPNIALLPATAQGIALALHELATNAAKHGALSSLKGNSVWRGRCSPILWC